MNSMEGSVSMSGSTVNMTGQQQSNAGMMTGSMMSTAGNSTPMTGTPGSTARPTTTAGQPTTEDENGCVYSCQNGGTIDNECICACGSGYQGDTCSESQEQADNGVKITIETSISNWNSMKATLLEAIEVAIDDHCNIDTNYGTCCPDSGEREGTGTLDYIQLDDIFVAEGYPTSNGDNSYIIMIVAIPQTDNNLCEAGSAYSSRKRRDIIMIEYRVKRNTVIIYLPQDVLLAAVVSSKANISAAIGVPLGEIKKGEVIIVEEEEVEEEEDGGIGKGVIVGVIIGVIALIVIAAGVIYLVLKDKKGRVANADGNAPNGT